jgi:cell wall-associated NlpC family hydrolase
MNEPSSSLFRKARIATVPFVAATILLGASAAGASSSSTSSTTSPASQARPQNQASTQNQSSTQNQASLQTQAQELAGQIESDGQNLDRVAEALDAAQLRASQLGAQLSTLQATMSHTSGEVTAARAALRQQALLSYVAGDAPIVSFVPGAAGADPSLTASYAEIVAGSQRRAVTTYRTVLATQRDQAKALSATQTQVAESVSVLQGDRAQAAQAMTARQQTLAQVTGQLATLVTQVQRSQQRAEQTTLKATLASHQDLPGPSRAVEPPAPAATTTTTLPAPAQAAAPPPPVPAPSTTAPRPIVTSPPPTSPPTTAPPPPVTAPPAGGNVAARGSSTAVRYAYAQLGKPYQWAGAGPNAFDCSGLTMQAWGAAGVYLPHLAQGQYDMTRHVPLSDVLPGDLIFFGTPNAVYHVGIYIGGGQMIDAPETGQNVSISSIYWTDLLGAGRIID